MPLLVSNKFNNDAKAKVAGTLVMAPKSVTFRRHDHLVSVLFGDLLSHSYNITFSIFLYVVVGNNKLEFQGTIDCSWLYLF